METNSILFDIFKILSSGTNSPVRWTFEVKDLKSLNLLLEKLKNRFPNFILDKITIRNNIDEVLLFYENKVIKLTYKYL